MLYLNDLYALKLNAELAVLSACETSMGRYAPGEGVLSLARAFARAGAASTLTTLWKVDDEATKELMVQFYTALNRGASRSEAVTVTFASATANSTFAHPYFWSALTLYGSPDTLVIATNPNRKNYLVGSLILISVLLVAGLLVRRGKKA
jgi:CHAT domain-containing protein